MKGRLLGREHWVYGVFLVLVVAFFFDLLFLGKYLLLRDTFADFIPKLALAKRAYLDFVVPLWNPQTGCGHPFFADPYTGAAYPLNVLFYLLPMSVAHKLSLVLHMTLAGWGMIALARLWGFGRAAALLGAIGFVFSTYVVAAIEFFNVLFPVCWGPVIFYFGCLVYERAGQRKRSEGLLRTVLANWKTISVLAICFACNYLSGNPQYLVFAILLVGSYYLARLLRDRDLRRAAVSSGIFLGAGAISLLLCMPQILPFLELLGESIRSKAIDPALHQASMPPSQFFSVLFPFLFGKAGWPDAYWSKGIFEFWLGAFYVGVLPLLAAGYALLSLRRSVSEEMRWSRFLSLFFLVGILFGILLASGKYLPVYEWFFHYVPGFDKVRWPSRFMLFWVYFVPLGAALGLDLVVRAREKGGAVPRAFWIVPGVGAALAAALWVGTAAGGDMATVFRTLTGEGVEARDDRLELFRADWRAAAVFLTLGVGGFVVLLRGRNALTRRLALGAIVGAAFLNMVVVGRQVHPVSSENVYEYEPDLWRQLEGVAAADPHWRIYTMYGVNQYHLHGVADPRIYKLAKTVSAGETWLQSKIARAWRSSLGLDRYFSFYHTIPQTGNDDVAFKFIDLLNARYVILGPPWAELERGFPEVKPRIVERTTAVPRAYLVKNWQRPASFEEGVRAMAAPEFEIQRDILLEPAAGGEFPALPEGAGGAAPGRVLDIRYDWDSVEIEVDAQEACLLVLVDSFFPGWEARVGEVSVPIFRANLLFRAVEIPAGARVVRFEYRPPRWRVGLALCAAGVAIIGGGFQLRRRYGVNP